MKKIIVLFSAMFVLNSCGFYKLSKSDLSMQPYKAGDILIFESNKGELDTIEIKEVEVHTNFDDPLDLLPNMVQSLFVVAKYSVLEMRKYKTGAYIYFTIRLGDNDLKYPCMGLSIQELEKLSEKENSKITIKAIQSCDNMKDRPFDLRYIYWSKKYGYLGLEFKDNYVWNLKSFVRDGIEIVK